MEREQRKHQRTASYSVFGRSYCYITCPFCGTDTKAFIWSLNGSGKKCQCGALHGGWGYTLAPLLTTKKQRNVKTNTPNAG